MNLRAAIIFAFFVISHSFPDQWFEQKLDHFDLSGNSTWKQRFLENDRYYQQGGPILLFVGGEWTIDSSEIDEGFHIADIAKEVGGIIFNLEHRFYGLSRPTE